MEFIKKNFVTIMVVGATIVLAGVAVFTALRLYNLRNDSVTPASPSVSEASVAPVGIRPKSGNESLPEYYVITNTSTSPVEVVWHIDCWDELVCQDEQGVQTLAPGESIEKGLGLLCSQWQLDLNYSGTSTGESNEVWDWAGISETDPECNLDEAGANIEQNTEVTLNAEGNDYEVIACTQLSFSLNKTGTGGVASLSPSPIETVSSTATPKPSATAIATPKASSTPASELPEAGISTPTVVGIGAGVILLILALTLAI